MKTFTLLLFVMFSAHTSAQLSNLETIKDFYSSIDKFDVIERFLAAEQRRQSELEAFLAEHQQRRNEHRNRDTNPQCIEDLSRTATSLRIHELIRERNLEVIKNGNTLVFLYPKLQNAKEFRFSKNIYDFLVVDTTLTKVIHLNEKNGGLTYLTASGNIRNFTGYSRRIMRNLRRFFSFIEEQEPDVLFLSGRIFWEGRNNSNYLFMKDGEVFVFRTRNGRVYELNRFVRRFFNEEEFIRRAILEEQGLVMVGD